ncbi:MAG TPA: cell wall-binding repeat-containing protein, partial [Coriobacteriia bacterium]|nr:cell wall-binding repeat-containing protein [Coriobacteriia bacterium]
VLFFTGLTLAPEDTNDDQDFYVKDMDTGEYRWIDFFGDGSPLGRGPSAQMFAGDGSFFIFESYDGDILGTGRVNASRAIWGYDLESEEATLVSAPSDPLTIAEYGSRDAAITDDGRYVVFFTGNDWDPADTNNTDARDGQDFYVKDMDTGTVRWIDFHGDGSELDPNRDVSNVAIAGGGSRFVFQSRSEILPGVSDTYNIFAYDLVDDEAELVSGPMVEERGSRDPSISDDGRYVMFFTGQSFADDDTNSDPINNTGQDIYIKDMDTDEFMRIPMFGPESTGDNIWDLRISGDGEHCVFEAGEPFSVQDLNHDDDVYYYPIGGKFLAEGAERFEGDDRYQTAIEISQQAFPYGAGTVVIATGENWPDALGGSALAGAVEGPILLTPSDSLHPGVVAEMQRLKAGNVYLLGGYGAVSPEVEAQLNAVAPGFVWRLGGADRYATSASIAKRTIGILGGKYDGRICVTTGANYPDAVGGAPLAAGMGWPILLVQPTATTMALPTGANGAAILGGTSAVSDALETYLEGRFGDVAVDRLGGSDRYETSAKVAQYGVHNGMVWDGVGIATGTNFPDSLAGGVALGLYRSVLLLTPTDSLHPQAAAKLEDNKADIESVVFLGGPAAISTTVETAVKAILGL